jgi:nucleotide-binding universal stress UspA family protein
MAYKRILVPVDGSPTSVRGLKEALRMARASGARLRLVHVVDDRAVLSVPEVAVDITPVLDSMRKGGARTLARMEALARGAGTKPDTELVTRFAGRVADAVAQQARRWRPDLIVMGTHGRRGVQRALMGSDAELVVRRSTVPVLLVPDKGRSTRR